jgi:hypothetical protein
VNLVQGILYITGISLSGYSLFIKGAENEFNL